MPREGAGAIEEIKSRLNILDVIGRYLELRPAGSRFTGVCPFHAETKPSFSVNPELGFYHCFGCQASGDVIDFYCRINGFDFKEALEALAREAGVELGYGPERSRGSGHLRTRCLEMHSLAHTFFRQQLQSREGAQARSYLGKRGVPGDIQDAFGLGYSPNSWKALTDHLRRAGFSPEQGVEAGLLSKNASGNIFDRFRSRVIFPIHSLGGQVVAFGGRIIGEGDPKYLNSSESPIYRKGEHLYGLFQARQEVTASREALLSEGYLDVISMHQYGYRNSCGVLGTAFTNEQVRRLAGFCSRVVLVFDGDRAGRQAAVRSAEMILAYGLECRVITLPDGEDIDSLLHGAGSEEFNLLLANAHDGLEFCFQMLRLVSPRERVGWAQKFLLQIQDVALRGYYLSRVSASLAIPEQDLRRGVEGSAPAGGRVRPDSRSQRGPVTGTALRDKELLEFAIRHPQYLQELSGKEFGQALSTERARAFWEKLLREGAQGALLVMDENERSFYIRCQVHEKEGESPETRFAEICAFLDRFRIRSSKAELRSRLQAAQMAGDEAEVMRLLGELKESLGN
jgi:DNA primase